MEFFNRQTNKLISVIVAMAPRADRDTSGYFPTVHSDLSQSLNKTLEFPAMFVATKPGISRPWKGNEGKMAS